MRIGDPLRSLLPVAAAAMLIAGCAESTAPEPLLSVAGPSLQQRSADRCTNVDVDGQATLGVVALPDGTVGLGADGRATSAGIDRRHWPGRLAIG